MAKHSIKSKRTLVADLATERCSYGSRLCERWPGKRKLARDPRDGNSDGLMLVYDAQPAVE